jgi:hypothetical protein
MTEEVAFRFLGDLRKGLIEEALATEALATEGNKAFLDPPTTAIVWLSMSMSMSMSSVVLSLTGDAKQGGMVGIRWDGMGWDGMGWYFESREIERRRCGTEDSQKERYARECARITATVQSRDKTTKGCVVFYVVWCKMMLFIFIE